MFRIMRRSLCDCLVSEQPGCRIVPNSLKRRSRYFGPGRAIPSSETGIRPASGTMKHLYAFLFALFALLPGHVDAASVFLNQTFTGTSAPGWTLLGSAQLTAATGVDPNGSGFLRLTSAANNQAGFAYDNTAIPSGYGIDVSFRYSVWGGSGADGFALVLFDGSQTPTSAGAYGGSLGYAQHGAVAGLAGGILGIGFDEFGNYANPTEGRQGGVGPLPDAISIRGPGDGTANALSATGAVNYGFLTTTGPLDPNAIQASSWAYARPTSNSSYRDAEVIVDTSQIPYGHLPVTVLIQQGWNGDKVMVAQYDAYQDVLSYYGSPANIPASIKFGFTGSTGGSTDYHEIQGLTVNSIQTAPGYATATVAAPESASLWSASLGLLLIAAGTFKKRGIRE